MTEMMPKDGPIYVFINGRSVGRASNVEFEGNASWPATKLSIEMEEELTNDRPDPVTDDDRKAHEWCDSVEQNPNLAGDKAHAAARAIRAHIPAPPATLAEEVRTGLLFRVNDTDVEGIRDAISLADRVEAVEKENRDMERELNNAWDERDGARAEVQRLTTELARKEASRQHYIRHAQASSDDREKLRAEVERLKQDRTSKESLPVALPDPADVPKSEAWKVRTKVFGVPREVSGIKSHGDLWRVVDDEYMDAHRWDSEVTLVARLVPDVRRVIDRPEDLDKLPEGAVILDHRDGISCQKVDGLWKPSARDEGSYDSTVFGPVTVIHEPEVTA